MAAQLPPDVTIEPIFLIEATCAPDAAETRVPFRAEHAARLAPCATPASSSRPGRLPT